MIKKAYPHSVHAGQSKPEPGNGLTTDSHQSKGPSEGKMARRSVFLSGTVSCDTPFISHEERGFAIHRLGAGSWFHHALA